MSEETPRDKVEQANKDLEAERQKLYQSLYEHYAALRRLLEHAIVSIDAMTNILFDAKEKEDKAANPPSD